MKIADQYRENALNVMAPMLNQNNVTSRIFAAHQRKAIVKTTGRATQVHDRLRSL